MADSKLRISAVLCTINEDYYLEECLRSIAWADEIIVCDMGSTDRTVKIAQKYNCKIFNVNRVPYVELLRQQAIGYCTYDWICFVDPDFIMPENCLNLFLQQIAKKPETTCFCMSYINYYANKPVEHGRWGKKGYYPILFKKAAMQVSPDLHGGFMLEWGEKVNLSTDIYIKHMWVRDENHFWDKFWRYIDHEGARRMKLGLKPSRWRTLKLIVQMLNYYIVDGYKDGKLGFYLMIKSIKYELEAEKNLNKVSKDI